MFYFLCKDTMLGSEGIVITALKTQSQNILEQKHHVIYLQKQYSNVNVTYLLKLVNLPNKEITISSSHLCISYMYHIL